MKVPCGTVHTAELFVGIGPAVSPSAADWVTCFGLARVHPWDLSAVLDAGNHFVALAEGQAFFIVFLPWVGGKSPVWWLW